MVDIVLFIVFILIILFLAWWSIRQNDKNLREYNARMQEIYRNHGYGELPDDRL